MRRLVKALLYPSEIFNKTGFDRILQLISANCAGELGKKKVNNIKFYTNAKQLKAELEKIKEAISAVKDGNSFPLQSLNDLSEVTALLQKENAVLSLEALVEIRDFLSAVTQWYRFVHKNETQYPALFAISSQTEFMPALADKISEVIGLDGEILSSASPELKKIRQKIGVKESELNKKFNQILEHSRKNYKLGEGEESVRNGRRVIALTAEYKRSLKGIIHDESASGKTVFIEPVQTIELSNERFELQQEEAREIYRILKQLSAVLRPHAQLINDYQTVMAEVDFLHARVLLAKMLTAEVPEINQSGTISLINARHPLLLLHNKEIKRETVPLSLQLDESQRILLISGPNAGGKSVSLKTVALLQIMFQAAIPVPVDKKSSLSVFDSIFVDIGDEQSIENDLSTYSSHLKNMSFFLSKAGDNSLIFIDEFGTGTDPHSGGAIAEAMLKSFLKLNCKGVITTHFANLKLFADQSNGIRNAAMQFNQEKLEPDYKLITGFPGSSFAFEIARKSGLPAKIIDEAERLSGDKYHDFDTTLAEIQEEKRKLSYLLKEYQQKEADLSNLKDTYQKLKNEIEQNKKEILIAYKKSLLDDVNKLNKAFEQLQKKHREATRSSESKLNRDIERELGQEISVKKQKLKKELSELEVGPKFSEDKKMKPEDLQAGMNVQLKSSGIRANIISVKGEKLTLSAGTMELQAKLKDVIPLKEVSPKSTKPVKQPTTVTGQQGIDMVKTAEAFSDRLDIRGMRREDALNALQKYTDQATVLGKSKVWIIHGKGDGILRKAVVDFFKSYKNVLSVTNELPQHGGDGVSIISFSD